MPRELKPCGTAAAFRRHLRHEEQPCEACYEAERERQRESHGWKPLRPARCGTVSGYRRHLRAGERACAECRAANAAATRMYVARRAGRGEPEGAR